MELHQVLLGAIQIMFIDLLLSGDNALVIALACRELEGRKRWIGMVLGAVAALVVRFSCTFAISFVLSLPYLKIIGALMLMWVAVRMFLQSSDDENGEHSHSIWEAVMIIVAADMVMSVDNIIAIAAVAQGHGWLLWFGLTFSIPIIVMGAAAISFVLNKAPVLVPIGACFLGYLAGSMIVTDPLFADRQLSEIGMGIVWAGAVFLIGAGRKWFREMPG